MDDFMANYPEPPKTEYRIHPDDLSALKQIPVNRDCFTNGQTPSKLFGVDIILDDKAPRLLMKHPKS